MLNSIQNTELTRLINKLDVHTKSFVNYKVDSISSDRIYKDGTFEEAIDKIRLWGFVPNKCSILIDYTVKYNFGISNEYEHTLSVNIITQDEDGRFVSTPIPNDVDSIDALIRYLQTTLK